MKQSTDILKFSYENLEEFSVAANNDTERESELKREAMSSDSSELSDLQDAEITVKQLKEELQNSNIMNVIRNFSDTSTSNWEINKKDCICALNLSELRKVLQNHYREIKKSMCLSDRNNLKKDENAQTYS